MRIFHPMSGWQGTDPENLFVVENDHGRHMGSGYTEYQNLSTLYPAQPTHIYLNLSAPPEARSMLFGALMARAWALRMHYPAMPARIYTQLKPTDNDLLNFFMNNGFHYDDAEDQMRFPAPTNQLPLPEGYSIYQVMMDTQTARDELLVRANAYRMVPLAKDFWDLCMQNPGLLALCVCAQDGSIVAEIVAICASQNASIISLYTHPAHRRIGLAKLLIHACGYQFSGQGVREFRTLVLRRNGPQTALLRRFGAAYMNPNTALPGIDCPPLHV